VLSGLAGSSPLGFYSKKHRQAADKALDKLGILNLAGYQFNELSGGQRQRVLISRALVNDPELLLLDEPTSNVDSEAEARLFDIIKELHRRMTILMVSHDLGFVSEMVKTVVCVNRRVIVHPTSAITEEAIRSIYEEDIRLIRHDLDTSMREAHHD
jgi:zinc transport system ATP-binding protein